MSQAGESVAIRCLDVVINIPQEHRGLFDGFSPTVDTCGISMVSCSADDALNAEMTRAVIEHTGYLAVHAAVIHTRQGALVMPAASGAGKSTLAAALARSGYGLLSDELAAFGLGGEEVHAFPRPLGLDARSAQLLGLSFNRVGSSDKQCYPATLFGPLGPATAPIAATVLLDRGGAHGPRLEEVSGGVIAAALVEQCFNHFRGPAAALRTIATISSRPAFRLTYRTTDEAIEQLSRHFQRPSA